MTDDSAIFSLLRRKKIEWTRGVGGLTQIDVDETNAVLAEWKARNGLDLAAPAPSVAETAPKGARQPSAKAVALMHEFEGCRLKAYPDPGSRDGHPWTIGYGATGPGIGPGTVWTQQQADERFLADLTRFAAKVDAIAGPTTQGQFDALVSFAYNVGAGEGGLKTSTLLRLHNNGDYAGAEAQFARWNKNDGKVMAGLTRRRAAEAALYGGRA